MKGVFTEIDFDLTLLSFSIGSDDKKHEEKFVQLNTWRLKA